jgi:3-hydroxyacyl-[acyl-carrier-protein] dehydratase
MSAPTVAAMHSRIEVPSDHPAFAGHFPRFPVLPGAVLIDAALQVIQRDRSIDLTQWQITSAKFLELVRPGDALRVEHEAPRSGLIRFTIRVTDPTPLGKDRIVASGKLSSAAQTGSGA